ncbi:hypothetical protein EVAR_50835_1 [Eumeta japonica]|uniref:Uncharacterized protein n=1 Tax=Eumeta variegata TaxID=151549 RepID=A0A4C1XDT5_EUMVA|nr:hypothetical protein EVAR_50835_1 [Eumeta japonica]
MLVHMEIRPVLFDCVIVCKLEGCFDKSPKIIDFSKINLTILQSNAYLTRAARAAPSPDLASAEFLSGAEYLEREA